MNYLSLANAYNQGRFCEADFYTTTAVAVTPLRDLTYLSASAPAGQPYYGKDLYWNEFHYSKGIYHNPNVDKYIHKITVQSNAAGLINLAFQDYIVYAPFLDLSVTIPQSFAQAPWPRYADGKGVKAMLLMQVTGTGAGSCYLNYTNDLGNTYTTESLLLPTGTPGQYATVPNIFDAGVFLTIDKGSGIRSINSITFSPGMTGMAALVILKPVTEVSIFETTAPNEVDYFLEGGFLHKVPAKACLGYTLRGGAAGVLQGNINFIW